MSDQQAKAQLRDALLLRLLKTSPQPRPKRERGRASNRLTAQDVLDELILIGDVATSTREFVRNALDRVSVVATLQIDEIATTGAGHVVYWDEPTKELLACLSACRAYNRDLVVSKATSAHSRS